MAGTRWCEERTVWIQSATQLESKRAGRKRAFTPSPSADGVFAPRQQTDERC